MQGNSAARARPSEETNTMKNEVELALEDMNLDCAMSQSEAAALAVLAAHLSKNLEEMRAECEDTITPEKELAQGKLREFLFALEDCAVRSIKLNDAKVVYWLGQAAKQMNPLLS